MSDRASSFSGKGVPATDPKDLPMPPYRFQKDDRAVQSATASETHNDYEKQAERLLRDSKLLSCAAHAPY